MYPEYLSRMSTEFSFRISGFSGRFLGDFSCFSGVLPLILIDFQGSHLTLQKAKLTNRYPYHEPARFPLF